MIDIEQSKAGLFLPGRVLRQARLRQTDDLEVHLLDGVLLLIKAEMDASQLLAVLDSLHTVQERLLESLEDACGPCDEECPESCPIQMHLESGVPTYQRNELLARGVCMEELFHLLDSGETVYGSD